jgi:hypothetical protein
MVVSFKMTETFPPVRKCIYCDATVYAPDANRKLGDEHIIPLALDGDLVLPEASCRTCERLTGNDEAKLAGGIFLAFRTKHNFPSRSKKKDRPTHLPFFGRDKRVELKVEDAPINLMMLRFDKPDLLNLSRDNSSKTRKIMLWRNIDAEFSPHLASEGVDYYTSPLFDVAIFCRFLAKIAHSYCCAVIGASSFKPMLRNFIRRKEDENRFKYVGGLLEPEPETESLHELSIEVVEVGDIQYVVTRIRLFAMRKGPTYRVVTGILDGTG